MYAITLKQPWAQAVAHFSKTVENRTRRPPAHLLGQRVAIHVSQTVDEAAVRLCHRPPDVVDHLEPMLVWLMQERMDLRLGDPLLYGAKPPIPSTGRVIATARLVGCCWRDANGEPVGRTPNAGFGDDETLVVEALGSPWFTGPVGWVLADVRPLAVPVGHVPKACNGAPEGWEPRHGWRVDGLCAACGERKGGGPIRGQVYPFALSPEVEAAVLAQEAR